MTPDTALGRRFEAAVFDWDGTAVPDRKADATRLRHVVEDLCARGFHVAVVSGTHVDNVDRQLGARPKGPGRLYVLVNRGSEVFRIDDAGVLLLHQRTASPAEDAALTAAALRTKAQLAERGLPVSIVSSRLNRRKIDLIPEPTWADPPKAQIGELLRAVEHRLLGARLRGGLAEVIAIARASAESVGLADPRVTSDVKHVEIGLTDKSDSACWILRELWSLGIGPELLLMVGDEWGPLGGARGSDALLLVPGAEPATVVSVGAEPGGVPPGVIALGGGPASLLHLLEDQIRRRDRREVPRVDRSPSWFIEVNGLDAELERVHEVELTIADGCIGTSGSPLSDHPAARPWVLAAGLWDGEGPTSELAPCPSWNRLPGEAPPGNELRRVLDLHTGLLRHERADGVRSEALMFSSLARRGVMALRWAGGRGVAGAGPPLVASSKALDADSGEVDGQHWMRLSTTTGEVVAAAAESRRPDDAGSEGIDRLAAYVVRPPTEPSHNEAIHRLKNARETGFEELLTEHRHAWAARWEDADIAIHGDPELQLAVRFALFHLMSSVADSGEAPVGARGLSGPAYLGHVFWDSDVFVLPFLAATHPPAARAMLEYRVRRLAAARARAHAAGLRGARFPWESAATGADVTPTSAVDLAGEIIPIKTGEHEEHIVADVAWAAACYIDWTGDRVFADGPGRALLVETARYWKSRIRTDAAGRGHIDKVIGPDEYHELVDDNAFTNVMARWNLRRAATLPDGDLDVNEQERRGWLDAAAALVDGYDPSTGVYEQFAGFRQLEPLIIADLAPNRPVAADYLLGHARVQAAQVIKQADVLMLHHLIPGEVAPGSLAANLAHYEPRTAHGSSLSPGIHAALLARAGRLDAAVSALRLASRIDLDDLTGTTAGGLHLAAMGSVWQALALGFVGLRPDGAVLAIDPRIPAQWTAMELRVRFRGSRVHVRIAQDSVTLRTDHPVSVKLAGDDLPVEISSGERMLARRGQRWEWVA